MSTVTQEQLSRVQAILQQLDHTKPNGDTENRRRANRLAVQMSLTLIVLGIVNPAPVQIYTRNLSISGIGFVSRRLFKSHERTVIYFRAKNLPAKLILARVTFGRYAGGGYYEMGAEFLESIPDAGNARIPNHWMLGSPSPRAAKSTT